MSRTHEQQRAAMLKRLAHESPLAFIEIARLLTRGESDAQIDARFRDILKRHPNIEAQFSRLAHSSDAE